MSETTRIVFVNGKTVEEYSREYLLADMNQAFLDQNDYDAMDDNEIREAWTCHGIHAGTWPWERIVLPGQRNAPVEGWARFDRKFVTNSMESAKKCLDCDPYTPFRDTLVQEIDLCVTCLAWIAYHGEENVFIVTDDEGTWWGYLVCLARPEGEIESQSGEKA